MRFQLIDQIVDLVPGKRIEARKNLTIGEEYLADHFPGFPVMPGVLMLEAMVQAGAWLLRVTEDFNYSVIALRGVKGIKYASFLQPGFQMDLTVEITGKDAQDGEYVEFRGKGLANGNATVTGRFMLEQYRLKDRSAELAALDDQLTAHYRRLYAALCAKPGVQAKV